MENNYKDTLNLPGTSFPMKANLPVREVEIQSSWEKAGIYGKIRKKMEGRPLYILHDGPPYANESIHIGTALNKILKDFIVKSKTMSGHDAPYVPGWDCHGLPIELQAIKKLSAGRRGIPPAKLRQKCRQHAEKYVSVQKDEFRRLGVFGEWENPYLTMSPEYEAAEIEVFRELWSKGYVYRGLRPIHWCPSCRTALADAEIEYYDKKSPSVYLVFRLKESPEEAGGKDVNLLVWTTTPWTLVSNVAVAVHPEADYSFFSHDGRIFALAENLLERVSEKLGFAGFKPLFRKKGSQLHGLTAEHPFIERDSAVLTADFVSREEGTGFVHSAPGHGREDFEMGLAHGLPALCPVDEGGVFTGDAGEFSGKDVFSADEAVVEKLRSRGALVLREELTHSYPACWRCRKPLITRATEQWFISVSRNNLREKLLSEADAVEWIPEWGRTRIKNMAAARPDWCISRQRLWGVPIPVFHCGACREVIASGAAMGKIKDIFAEHGSDAWFEKSVEELAGSAVLCPRCGSSDIRKETDIFDVWFDSGVSSRAVLEHRESLRLPADLYLEGTDQHRGWFQTSLIVAAATTGRAPYKTVLTHGFMVDGDGRKMSKSIGNLIPAQDLVKQYGADILRLWVSAEDYRNDIKVSAEILAGIAESYKRFRNTARYMLGNLGGFEYGRGAPAPGDLPDMEKWILHKLHSLIKTCRAAYDRFEFHKVYHSVHDFCAVTLSAFYFDVIKDRLYASAPAGLRRKASLTVMHEIFDCLMRLMAPIMPHTCEEAWRHFTAKPAREDSIHLEKMPEPDEGRIDPGLDGKWETVLEARRVVNKVLENARISGVIGNSLQASVALKLPAGAKGDVLRGYWEDLPEIFIVSEVNLEESKGGSFEAEVRFTGGRKCPRCWKYSIPAGETTTQSEVCARCARVLREIQA